MDLFNVSLILKSISDQVQLSLGGCILSFVIDNKVVCEVQKDINSELLIRFKDKNYCKDQVKQLSSLTGYYKDIRLKKYTTGIYSDSDTFVLCFSPYNMPTELSNLVMDIFFDSLKKKI